MNSPLARAEVLVAQGRWDLAERELGQALADWPDSAYAHALLAACKRGRRDYPAAVEHARRAVGLDPELTFAHLVLALSLASLDRLTEAEGAARTARDLSPANPDVYGLLSDLRYRRDDWAGALAWADEGLAQDARHPGCLSARAMALTKLGRKDEAARTVDGILADNPEDPFAHLTQGWTALHQSDPDKALEHFREALRLNPELEPAREGMVLALKARYRAYRLLLRFFLWLHTRGRRFRWGLVFVLIAVHQVLAAVVRNAPESAGVVGPVIVLLFAAAAVTWLADPLFNLLLRFNRFGRHAVAPSDRACATWVGLLLAGALAALAFVAAVPTTLGTLIPLGFVLAAILVCGVYRMAPGRRRIAAAVVAAVLMGVYVAALHSLDTWVHTERRMDEIAREDKADHDAAAAAGQAYQTPAHRWVDYRHQERIAADCRDRVQVLAWVFALGFLGVSLASQAAPGRRR